MYEKVVGKGKKKEYPHLQSQTKERAERKPLNMETSEGMGKVLLQEAEAAKPEGGVILQHECVCKDHPREGKSASSGGQCQGKV